MAKTEHAHPLRIAREAAGLTREQLARRAETSTSTVARIELRGHVPLPAAAERLAEALAVEDPAELFAEANS